MYEGEHSITFGDKHTWNDWHLIPTSRPVFNPPSVKTNIINVPGADGSLDLTDTLTGYPLYANRSGSFEFAVANDYWNWEIAYSTIMNYIHGRRMKAILDDDPKYYYEGRFSVNSWKSGKDYSTITIDYNVAPFKTQVLGSLDDWLWDPFNFEEDVVYDYLKEFVVSGSKTIVIDGFTQRVALSITSNANMTATLRGKQYQINPGTEKVRGLIMLEGPNEITFTGNGIVSVDFRGGKL